MYYGIMNYEHIETFIDCYILVSNGIMTHDDSLGVYSFYFIYFHLKMVYKYIINQFMLF